MSSGASAAWAAGGIATAALAWYGAPSASWLDSGELIAAARELGVVHPPGHPAWLSLVGLADGLPLGPHMARVAWLSALACGAAVFALVHAAGRIDAAPLSRWWQAFAAIAPGLLLLGCTSLWLVGVRAEVYALQLATNMWALGAALGAGAAAARGEVRPALVGLASCGLGLALGLLNHHWVALFAMPACLVAAGPALALAWRRHRSVLGAAVLACAWLGAAYLALYWRAGAPVELRWGDPTTWAGWWDTVTARHFQSAVTGSAVPVRDNFVVLFGMVLSDLGPVGAAGGLGGLVVLGVQQRWRIVVALALAIGGALATKALMPIDTGNPDDHGYVLLAPAALALAFGCVLRALLAAGQGWALLATVATVGQLAGQAGAIATEPACQLDGMRSGDVVDGHLRRTLPPGALYLSNHYALGFNEQAFRVGEGRRPDVVAAHLSFRTGDTDGGLAFQRAWARAHPHLRGLASAAANLHRAPIGNVLALAEARPVYTEQDASLRIPPAYYGFDGLVHRLLPAAERSLDYDLAAERDRRDRLWRQLYAGLGASAFDDGPTRAVLVWQHALQAAHALRRGWPTVAGMEIERARRLSPVDATLVRLDARRAQLEAAWQRADTKAYLGLWQQYAGMDWEALTAPLHR